MNFDEQCYLADPYTTEFKSRVREVEPAGKSELAGGGETAGKGVAAGEGLWAVYLDRTFFYPESGGQPDDRGTLGAREVVAVAESEKGVRHLVKGKLRAGDEVEGLIDRARRFDHMQQHSGQHLLSRVFLEGYKLTTVSFHLGEEICTIDLEGNAPHEERLDEAEARASEIVFRNMPITCRIAGAAEIETSTVLRSRLPGGIDRVRIVEIEGFDSSACCGTHVRSTGEIGVVKILGLEKVKGNARVEFICGGRAAKDYAAKHKLLSAVAKQFTTEWREIPRLVGKLGDEGRELRKKNDELSRELAGFRAAGLSAATGSAGGFDIVKRVFDEGDAGSLRETATKIREMGNKIVLFGLSGPSPALIFACSSGIPLNMGEIMKACAGIVGARGGGGKDFAQGGGGDGARVSEALDEAERRIKETLE
jgi:alanyl-tRNA synthetase